MIDSADFEYAVYEDIAIKDEPIIETPEISATNWQLQTTEQPSAGEFHKKCGEIFIEPGQTYVLICSRCAKQYNDLESFGHHINVNHLYELESEYQPFESLCVDRVVHASEEKCSPQDLFELQNNLEPELNSTPKDSAEVNDISKSESNETCEFFSCKICNCKYKHKQSYNKHLRMRHGVLTNFMKDKLDSDTGEDVQQNAVHKKDLEPTKPARTPATFACTLCSRSYTQKYRLSIHVRLTHGPEAYATFRSQMYTRHCPTSNIHPDNDQDVDVPDIFSCSTCGSKYRHRRSYIKHLRRHHGIRTNNVRKSMLTCMNDEEQPEDVEKKKKLVSANSANTIISLRDGSSSEKDQLEINRWNHRSDTVTKFQSKRTAENYTIDLRHGDANEAHKSENEKESENENDENEKDIKLAISTVSEGTGATAETASKGEANEKCTSEFDESKGNMFPCSMCDSKYKHKQSYNKHLRDRHGILTSFMKEKIQYEAGRDAQQNIADEEESTSFTCTLCDRSYSQKYRLTYHVRAKHGSEAATSMFPKKVRCKYCDETVNQLELANHVESRHPGDSKYACSYCEKAYKTKGALKLHTDVHKGIPRKYSCPHCPKVFRHHSNLAVHIRIHLQIRNHGCRYCSKRFITTTERKIHERFHTGEKLQQCELCGDRFRTKYDLKVHTIRHQKIRNFKCDVCGKAFYTGRLLKDHKQVHSTERPFSCSTCGQNFPRLKTLRMHEQLHSDVKKYICNICGKAFAQCAGLYSHKKSHADVK